MRNGIFVFTPSILNSESARSDLCIAVSKFDEAECVITFASNESNIGLVVYPAYPNPSVLTPGPLGAS